MTILDLIHNQLCEQLANDYLIINDIVYNNVWDFDVKLDNGIVIITIQQGFLGEYETEFVCQINDLDI